MAGEGSAKAQRRRTGRRATPALVGASSSSIATASPYTRASPHRPTFDDPNDAIAKQRLQSLFPEREVVPIDARDLVWGLGAFHCLSQQVPATPQRRP